MALRRTVSGIIMNDRHQVLLVHGPHRHEWDLPSADFEAAEMPAIAVRRAVQAATGLTVTIDRFVGTWFCLQHETQETVFVVTPPAGQESVPIKLTSRWVDTTPTALAAVLPAIRVEQITAVLAGKQGLHVIKDESIWRYRRQRMAEWLHRL
ncbi:NUDIX domain-containing protein [Schleiferilactobacillus shenzhenensis]|uniref:Nudix hydrolase domain-containing protein n=1 Tax=Schleiferilactobacillus shenzhenensis LY-73 TaxID=1231336 RepID=U4TTB9_9LACO|nr:NUDIX domain-containing protein [Schleiferilactobacillus shenzhenensis]ERL65128.1 hypothetical protein L248_3066 [Schleiferilactobacillus shenzhenensis LY-73]